MVQNCLANTRKCYQNNHYDIDIFWVGCFVLFRGGQYFKCAGQLDFLKLQRNRAWKKKCSGLS